MAQNSYKRLKNIISELKKSRDKKNKKNIEIAKKQFLEIINNDFNTSNGLSFLWEILRDNKLNDSEKYELALDFDRVFGLELDKEEEIKIPKEVAKLIEEREKVREKKDWKKADELRKKINKAGYSLSDTKEGVKVKKNEKRKF